MTKILLCQRDG
uniref:Uncharacterized protein n=1 Tax=Anguilla anguilla TaxID=7936 RepID=A0A0E9QFV1_ANGAN